jgi:hypothetical protein
MKVTITIDTGNAAFEDGYSEVARILKERAERIEEAGYIAGAYLYDVNGNKVGQIKATGKR